MRRAAHVRLAGTGRPDGVHTVEGMSTAREDDIRTDGGKALADAGRSDDQRDALVGGNAADLAPEQDLVAPARGNEDPSPERSLADEPELDEPEFPEPPIDDSADVDPDAEIVDGPIEEDVSDLLPELGHGPDEDESALVEYGEEEDGGLAPSDAESRLDDDIVRLTGDEPADDVDPSGVDPVDADRGALGSNTP